MNSIKKTEEKLNKEINELIKESRTKVTLSIRFDFKTKEGSIETNASYLTNVLDKNEIKYKIPNSLKRYIILSSEIDEVRSSFDSYIIIEETYKLYLKLYGSQDIDIIRNKHCLANIITTLNYSVENIKGFRLYRDNQFKECIMEIYNTNEPDKYICEWTIISMTRIMRYCSDEYLLLMNLNPYSKFYGKIMMCDAYRSYVLGYTFNDFRLVSNNMHELIEKISKDENTAWRTCIFDRVPFKMNYDRELIFLIILQMKRDPDFIFNCLPLDILKVIWSFIQPEIYKIDILKELQDSNV